jgi:pyruvate/2-oxoglutarate dehydrogenase complex dihydrolipoamide acyltransferase (E2) component
VAVEDSSPCVHAIKEKPRVVDEEVISRPMLMLSLSFDHWVLDGVIAAQFTNEGAAYLEHPSRLWSSKPQFPSQPVATIDSTFE